MTIGWIPPDISTATSILNTNVQQADINMWLYVEYLDQDDTTGATIKCDSANPPTVQVFRASIQGAELRASSWIFIPKDYYYRYSGSGLTTMTKYACMGE